MSESDQWPSPDYNPGSRDHLHAIGVISMMFNAFERGLHDLYEIHPLRQRVPQRLIDLYFYSLNEDRRTQAIQKVFKSFERSPKVKAIVTNLVDYFEWCKDARNKVLHAEQYPALLGGDPAFLHLTKKASKNNPSARYIALTVPLLRSIADKMRAGQLQCAKVRIYLRVRGRHVSELSGGLAVYKHEPLPEKLRVPRPLRLYQRPRNTQRAARQPRS